MIYRLLASKSPTTYTHTHARDGLPYARATPSDTVSQGVQRGEQSPFGRERQRQKNHKTFRVSVFVAEIVDRGDLVGVAGEGGG